MKVIIKLSMFLFMMTGVLFSQPCDYHWGKWHGFGLLGGGFMILLWVILVASIVFLLVKVINKDGFSGLTSESPLDILKKRYARGEISKEELENMKKELS